MIDNVEVFVNHGTGAVVDSGTVRNSRFHHNGQLGLAGAGHGSLVIGNRIYENNIAGYDPTGRQGERSSGLGPRT